MFWLTCRASTGLQVAGLDDLGPDVEVGLDLRRQILRRAANNLVAEHGKALLRIGKRHGRLDFTIEQRDDVLRCSSRSENAHPLIALALRKTRLDHRRRIGKRSRALL